MKLSNRHLLVISLILSVITATLAYQYMKGVSTDKDAGELQTVVVAKRDIAPKTRLTVEMLQEEKVPARYVQPGAVSSLKALDGVLAKESIGTGEQVTERRLVMAGKNVGFTGIIPPHKRAIAVAVNEANGVGGLIKTGDYVDAIVGFDATNVGDNASRLLLQNLLVLAVNRDTGIEAGDKDASKEAVKTTTVTLAVDPEDAPKLSLAQDKGKISLALRPYVAAPEQVLTQVMTPKDLLGVQASPTRGSASPPATVPSALTPAMPPTLPPAMLAGAARGGRDSSGPEVMVIRGTKVEAVAVK